MGHKIFLNLPVKDLARSMAFYEALGWKHNPQFTDESAACMVFSEEIFVMLLTHERFKGFIKKEDEFLQKMKLRSENYFTSIETVLCKYDLPMQLKYLAIVESELRPNAVSKVGAKGM